MSAALNGLGHQLFAWLGSLSIELAGLAVLVLAACRLVKSPALRHLLWLAVLVKPVAAVVVSSPYTVFAPLAAFVQPGWDALPASRVEHPALAPLAAAPAAFAPGSVPFTPAAWGALLWLVGVTLLIGRTLAGFGILRRLRRQAHVQREGPLFAALRQARAALDCHPGVDVATSPSIRSPMVLGILRPLIVVPADLVQRLRGDELTLVLMHELAHVRRCDNLTLLLQRLVTAALFFHPAVWLCGRMLRREAEQACDDLVVGVTARPEAYARGLTLVAEEAAHSNPRTRRVPMMSTFAATESDLSQRIRRTLDGRASRMGPRARVLAVVLLFPLAAVTLPSYGAADNWVAGETASAIAADSSAAAPGRDEVVTLEELTDRMAKGIRMVEGIHTGGVRSIVAVPDSGVRVAIQGLDVTGSRKLDLDEAVARAIEQIEDIQSEAIGRIAAQGNELTGEETVHRILEALEESRIMREAVLTDPDEWSDELKGQLLALRPDSTIEEIAASIRNIRGGSVAYGYSALGIRTKPESLFLIVDPDGNMRLNEKSVTFANLGEELKKQRSLKDSTSMIIIQGDTRVSRAQIVEAMDIARHAGLVDQIIAETDSISVLATEP